MIDLQTFPDLFPCQFTRTVSIMDCGRLRTRRIPCLDIPDIVPCEERLPRRHLQDLASQSDRRRVWFAFSQAITANNT